MSDLGYASCLPCQSCGAPCHARKAAEPCWGQVRADRNEADEVVHYCDGHARGLPYRPREEPADGA